MHGEFLLFPIVFLLVDSSSAETNYLYDVTSKITLAGMLFLAVRILYAQNRKLVDERISNLENQSQLCNSDRIEMRKEIGVLNEKLLSMSNQNYERALDVVMKNHETLKDLIAGVAQSAENHLNEKKG